MIGLMALPIVAAEKGPNQFLHRGYEIFLQ
jgi:hypothetical protein